MQIGKGASMVCDLIREIWVQEHMEGEWVWYWKGSMFVRTVHVWVQILVCNSYGLAGELYRTI